LTHRVEEHQLLLLCATVSPLGEPSNPAPPKGLPAPITHWWPSSTEWAWWAKS